MISNIGFNAWPVFFLIAVLLGNSIVFSLDAFKNVYAQGSKSLDMLVVGDSVMWGQGLLNETKFYTLVENHLKSIFPDVAVNNRILAHSGAIIGKDISQPLFTWNKVPGEDSTKIKKLLDYFTQKITPYSYMLRWDVANIVKADENTIIVGPGSCFHEFIDIVCYSVKFSYVTSLDRVDMNVLRYNALSKITIPVYGTFSFKVENINGERQVFYGPLHGEINTSFPTILQQVRLYKSLPGSQDIDLVLVDGCINDVGATERITNPKVSTILIREITSTNCYEGMKQVLNEISNKFPNAKIIVTGYFQEVTDNSIPRLKQLIDWLFTYVHSSMAWLLTGIFLVGPVEGLYGTVDQLIFGGNPFFINSVVSNWETFYTESTLKLRNAVNDANIENPCTTCPFLGERISFVDPHFEAKNAIFAEEPFLYGFKANPIGIGDLGSPIFYYKNHHGSIPISAIDPDAVKKDRTQACRFPGSFALPGSFNQKICHIASIGHPNEQGSKIYANKIIEIVDKSISTKMFNIPPVANAGDDQVVAESSMVNLDGSGSYDSDKNDTIKFTWTQLFPQYPKLQIYNSSEAKPVIYIPYINNSIYDNNVNNDPDYEKNVTIDIKFKLTVTDSSGENNSDVVDIMAKSPIDLWGIDYFGDNKDNSPDESEGNNFIRGYGGDDKISGGDRNDALLGGDGNDMLWGGQGNDIIKGNNGNDFLSGNQGNDYISGGSGNDFLYGDIGSDHFECGDGYDRIDDYSKESNDTFENDCEKVFDDFDRINTNRHTSLNYFGNQTNNVINGTNSTDFITGYGGNDNISGFTGNDVLIGDDGNDIIFGFENDDIIKGNNGNDFLSGNQGNDYISGGSGNDILYGGLGGDYFECGDGYDEIWNYNKNEGDIVEDGCEEFR